MDLVDEWSLKALLAECQNVDLEDKEGKDDYAFLEETIFPTLMPALVHLLEHAEEQGAIELPAGAAPASRTPAQPDPVKAKNFNAQRWLAEHLVRHHPSGGIFKHDSAFATHLREISERRREQRVERERLVEEDQRKAEEMRLQQELERTKREEEARVAAEEARKLAAEEKLAAREAASEAAVRAAAPQEHLELIMGFRAACLAQIAAFDFAEKDSTAELVDAMHRDAALLLATHSRASYVAFGSLVDADTLLYHTAADKKEFLLEDEEDEEDAAQGDDAEAASKEKKVPRPPEITVRALPPRDAEQACVIRRGRGVTFEEVVDTGTAKCAPGPANGRAGAARTRSASALGCLRGLQWVRVCAALVRWCPAGRGLKGGGAARQVLVGREARGGHVLLRGQARRHADPRAGQARRRRRRRRVRRHARLHHGRRALRGRGACPLLSAGGCG